MTGLALVSPSDSTVAPRAVAPRAVAPRLPRQVASFAAIGVLSTAAYVALYAILRPAMDATLANAIALIATGVANTEANRRLTFARVGWDGAVRDQAAGLLALGIALVITTASVALLSLAAPRAGRTVELVVLVAANALATLSRFVLLRAWIASPARQTTRTGATR